MGRTQNPPHFLVISPPKTGSTWLAENLRCHPDLYLPECKELKYFSSLHRFVGPEWYRAQFARALGRLAGEASPSYAALPSSQIERIHREYPQIRLLFLMRDPISRAWSHARHAHRFQEGRFDGVQTGAPSDADWVACCESDWLMTSGDYLGQLKRWLAFFPREQFLIGFYESIANEPERLLRTAFRFLGTDDGVDLSTFPTRERVFPGPERGLPASVEASLRVLWHARTLELVEFLRTRLGLEPPREWERTTGPPRGHATRRPPVAAFDCADDEYLSRVSAHEASAPTAYREIELGYRKHNIVLFRGRLYALPALLGPLHLPEIPQETLDRMIAEGDCVVGDTLDGLRGQLAERYCATQVESNAPCPQQHGIAPQDAGITRDPSRGIVPKTGKPEVVLRHGGSRKKVSVVLIDWGVRESFHSLEYLNRQTAPREDYELMWVEFYGRKPRELVRMAAARGRPMIDQWLVLGYPDELYYHKHRAYNAGLLAASGDIVIICDSDAMFRPTFIENIIKAFDETAYAVIHVDEVRNVSPDYYPFNYPTFEQVMGEGSINWFEVTTRGLYTEEDRLHRANYGACFAARRSELLAIGGADEHFDYLGFCCGPYEMTFRLLNRGRRERWLTSEYLYHTWHPNQTSYNSDYQGPHDGRYLSLRALHARSTNQVRPYLQNPCIRRDGRGRLPDFLRFVAEHPEPRWRADSLPTEPPDFIYRIDNDYRGFDVFIHKNEWLAVPVGQGGYDPARAARGEYRGLLRGPDEASIRAQMWAAAPDYPGPKPPGRVKKLVRSLMYEPIHTLPRRAWRAAKRKLMKTT